MIFYWLGFGSYLGNTIIYCFVLFFGFWRFFELLNILYPNGDKYFAIVLFYLPSVVFWSSGILKDGWCISAVFFIYYFTHGVFIQKKKSYKKLFWLVVWSYIAMIIRPFVFYIAFSSAMLWVAYAYLKFIKSKLLRTIAMPFILAITLGIGGIVITQMGDSLGGRNYSSMDAMLQQAWVIQDDLTRDYYGGNSFNIGSFEPTLTGVLAKAPIAIVSGMFRPFLWETNNLLMFLSGLESFIVMFLLLYFLIKLGLRAIIGFLLFDTLVRSLLVFAIIFAFVCGLTSANFGALVRYRIPSAIFLMVSMIIVYSEKDKPLSDTKTDF